MQVEKTSVIAMVERMVSFSCQRCLEPILVYDGFDNIDVHSQAELCLPTCKGNVNAIDARYVSDYDAIVPPYVTDSVNGNGFMLVSNRRDFKKLSVAFKIKAELFDSVSSNSEIDHPLCEECTDTMLKLMEHELEVGRQELKTYKNYLQNAEKTHQIPDLSTAENKLQTMQAKEQLLLNELELLKNEEISLKAAIETEKEQKQELEKQEYLYWREYTKHRRELMLTEDDKRSLELQISYAEQRLEQLKDTNIFNITFHIWYTGHFGTINNFRLGRLPAASVDWSEINAAWGQTVLLLCALARKLNLTFERYRIIPFGNHSFVEVLSDRRELPLYGTGGFKFFWDTKFDAAMVAFLDCLTQFQKEVEKRDHEFVLPYKMEKGKIIDPSTGNFYSIKIQFNSEEQWTKALKFMLTNLKWGLAWVSSQFTN